MSLICIYSMRLHAQPLTNSRVFGIISGFQGGANLVLKYMLIFILSEFRISGVHSWEIAMEKESASFVNLG